MEYKILQQLKAVVLFLAICVGGVLQAQDKSDNSEQPGNSVVVSQGSDFGECQSWFKSQRIPESKWVNGVFHQGLQKGESRVIYELNEAGLTLVFTVNAQEKLERFRCYVGAKRSRIDPSPISLDDDGSFNLTFKKIHGLPKVVQQPHKVLAPPEHQKPNAIVPK